jgi:hypothetical protein
VEVIGDINMNIFVTSKDANIAASNLDDKRVIKMVLETAQMLSTAVNMNSGKGPYKNTHVNHPCTKWVRLNRNNYNWALDHFIALCKEYTSRYNKIHKCEQYIKDFTKGISTIPSGSQTEFPNCTTYKEVKDVTKAYQLYLNDKWENDKRVPTWHKKGR